MGTTGTVIETRVPPPFYALATAGLIWLADRSWPAARVIGAPWNHAGWAPIVFGTALDCVAIAAFIGRRTTINPMRPAAANELIVSGVNAWSRNPMYLGLVLSLSGWALLLGNPACEVLVWMFARLLVAVQIAPEEAALRAKFGARYEAYARQVNRWFGARGLP